jgi:hypothetical protein
MATAEGPFPMETTHTWTGLPGHRTQMALRHRGMPSGFVGLTAPVMAAAMQRPIKKAWQRSRRCSTAVMRAISERSTLSLLVNDLVVLVSAVELNLPGHDRTHRGAARHAVHGPWKVQLRLDVP